MKSLVLIPVLLGTSMASAQLRTASAATTAEQMRNARKMMEAQTETTVLEKLEQSRMNDERNRMQRFESLNFNVVQDSNASQKTQTSGYTY